MLYSIICSIAKFVKRDLRSQPFVLLCSGFLRPKLVTIGHIKQSLTSVWPLVTLRDLLSQQCIQLWSRRSSNNIYICIHRVFLDRFTFEWNLTVSPPFSPNQISARYARRGTTKCITWQTHKVCLSVCLFVELFFFLFLLLLLLSLIIIEHKQHQNDIVLVMHGSSRAVLR